MTVWRTLTAKTTSWLFFRKQPSFAQGKQNNNPEARGSRRLAGTIAGG